MKKVLIYEEKLSNIKSWTSPWGVVGRELIKLKSAVFRAKSGLVDDPNRPPLSSCCGRVSGFDSILELNLFKSRIESRGVKRVLLKEKEGPGNILGNRK